MRMDERKYPGKAACWQPAHLDLLARCLLLLRLLSAAHLQQASTESLSRSALLPVQASQERAKAAT